jgi:hypothetical protein
MAHAYPEVLGLKTFFWSDPAEIFDVISANPARRIL